MKKCSGVIIVLLCVMVFTNKVYGQTNELAIQHNDALDYIHLNYSSGGPYNFLAVYNGLIKYCNANRRPLPSLSYQELINLKNQVADVSSLLNVMQRQYSGVTDNEKNELNRLYQSLNSAQTDGDAEGIIQNFNNRINRSSYSVGEKNKLLAVSSSLFTIGDFWSSTENFMEAPGETRTWTQRVNSGLPMAHSERVSAQHQKIQIRGPYDESYLTYAPLKKCRLLCVLCVVIQDAIMLAILTPIYSPQGAAVAAAAWSALARCCICSHCGNTNCWND